MGMTSEMRIAMIAMTTSSSMSEKARGVRRICGTSGRDRAAFIVARTRVRGEVLSRSSERRPGRAPPALACGATTTNSLPREVAADRADWTSFHLPPRRPLARPHKKLPVRRRVELPWRVPVAGEGAVHDSPLAKPPDEQRVERLVKPLCFGRIGLHLDQRKARGFVGERAVRAVGHHRQHRALLER